MYGNLICTNAGSSYRRSNANYAITCTPVLLPENDSEMSQVSWYYDIWPRMLRSISLICRVIPTCIPLKDFW